MCYQFESFKLKGYAKHGTGCEAVDRVASIMETFYCSILKTHDQFCVEIGIKLRNRQQIIANHVNVKLLVSLQLKSSDSFIEMTMKFGLHLRIREMHGCANFFGCIKLKMVEIQVK